MRWTRVGNATVTHVSYQTYVLRRWSIGAVHRVGPPWQPPAWLLLLLAASLMAAAATADRHEVGGHRDDEIVYLIVQVGDVALHL